MSVSRAAIQFVRDLYRAVERWQADDGFLMSAATAYYIGLSFFPLLLVLIAGLGWFLHSTHLGQDAQRQVLAVIAQNMSDELASYVGQALSQVQQKSSIGGPLGLATMLITSLAAFAQLDEAFDRIWKMPGHEPAGVLATVRNVLLQRGRAFLLLVALGFIIVIVFLAGMALAAVQSHTEAFLGETVWLWNSVQVTVTFSINVLVFTLMHLTLPKRRLRLSEAFRGGLLTAVAWEIGRQLLAAFVVRSDYTSAYGVIGAFLGVLLWCYYAVAIVLVGAEYVRILRDRRHHHGMTRTGH